MDQQLRQAHGRTGQRPSLLSGQSVALALLLALLLVGCAPAEPLPSSAVPSRSAIGQLIVPATATRTPLPTATATATERPPAEPTPAPSATPTVTPTPTATPCAAAGEAREETFTSQIRGPERTYRVWLPPCYQADGPGYPVLYLLHGNTWGSEGWEMMGFYDSAESLIADGTIPPFILVMPEGGWASNYTSGGPNAYEAIIVNELIPLIDASYCTANDAAYRAIGGVSRGGYWSLEIGFLYPELFASVGGHSAALYDNGAGPDINPQFTGITNDLGDLRIYFDIGEDDWLIPNIQTLHEEMTQAGIPHVWQLNEGAHADAYWAKHAPDYFQWYAEPWPHARDAYPPCAPLSGGG